jgi:hypothetical protein
MRLVALMMILPGLSANALSAPLFESDEVLDIVIEAPIRELSNHRHDNPEFAGTFRYTDASGTERALPIKVSPRGHSRLEICNYPQLKIDFDRDEVGGTLFAGQNKLKLVRQCTRGNTGSDWLNLEFGIYRAFNVITDNSFRVRKVNVTYRDTETNKRDQVQPAFFLEDDNDLAKRLNRQRIRPPQVDSTQMDPVETSQNILFQFLIGNTDFAVKRGPKGEGCCHNGRVIAEAGTHHDWIVVPYDFDYAGIINAKYAAPAEELPIGRVTTRLYRGFCWQNELLPESIDLFNRKRDEIEAALIPADVSKRKSRHVNKYLDEFYEIVNDREELQKRLLDKCRGPDSLPVRKSIVSPVHKKAPASD